MNQEDATRIILELIRKGKRTDYAYYGYDLYIPSIIRWYIRNRLEEELESEEQKVR